MISAIVAVDSNWGIGKDNNLLFNISEDMKRFKKFTTNKCVIMGSKTYESLPNKQPLPNRENIVITRKVKGCPRIINKEKKLVESNLNYIKMWLSNKEVIEDNTGIYIIGGGFIYKELLPFCERVYVTKVLEKYKSDTYFPNIDNMKEWKCVSESSIKEENGIKYKFCVYERIDYKIENILTHNDIKNIKKDDMIVYLKTFNSDKIVILKPNDSNFVDTNWLHLSYKETLNMFLDRVKEFNERMVNK